MAIDKLKDIEINWKTFFVIFGIAFVLRLLLLIEISASPFFENLVMDQRFYDLWAKSIQQGQFFPSGALYKAPLYPYFVWFIYAISGTSRFAVALAQILLGSASCAMLYLIARRFFSEKVAIGSGIILALNGVFMFLDTQLFSSSLAVFLLLSSMTVFSHIERSSRMRIYFIGGLLIGLATLVKPSAIIFGLLILLWLILRFRGDAIWKLSRWGLILCGIAAAVFPVAAHNFAASGDFILVSYDTGINCFVGNNLGADGKTTYLPGYDREIVRNKALAENLAESLTGKELSPAEISAFFAGQSATFVSRTPGKAALLTLKRTAMLLSGHEILSDASIYFQRRFSHLLSFSVWEFILSFPTGIILPLSIFGFVISIGGWRKRALLYCFAISSLAIPVLLYINAETRAFFICAATIFASAGLFQLVAWIRERKSGVPLTPIMILFIMLFISNFDFLDLEDDYTADYLRQGDVALADGRLDEAEEALTSGLKRNPDSPFLLNALGTVYFREGIYDKAEKKYHRALAHLPQYIEAHRNLVDLYETWGRDEMLPEAYSGLLEYEPESRRGLFWMAEHYMNMGNDDSAVVNYEKLASLYPDNPQAVFGLGNAYLKVGRSDDARELYEEMVQKYPEEPTVHLNLGLAYVQLKKYFLAEEEFTSVLYYDTSNTFALYNLGLLYETMGDSAIATSLFFRVFTIDPNFFDNPDAILDTIINRSKPGQMKNE
jgi:pentatricopeptide repeat protein